MEQIKTARQLFNELKSLAPKENDYITLDIKFDNSGNLKYELYANYSKSFFSESKPDLLVKSFKDFVDGKEICSDISLEEMEIPPIEEIEIDNGQELPIANENNDFHY